ncbi:MAG: hypothetical protein AAFR98_06495 [Pseudomonadota bacterium]
MRRRLALVGLFSAVAVPSFADTGHGKDGVGVSITSVGPDSLDPTKTAVGIQVDNDRRVDAILRSVQTNYGDAVMHKTVSLFGTTTRTTIQFLTINGRSTSFLRPPSRQITIDEPFSPEKYYAFGFDFGPIGQVYSEWGEA